MARQLERGTQNPLRHRASNFVLESDHTITNGGATPTWSSGTHRLTMALTHSHNDDFTKVSISSGEGKLPSGIYKCTVYAHLDNTTAGDETCQIALTSAAGATEHYVTPDLTVSASASLTTRFSCILHLTDDDNNLLELHASQTSGAGTDLEWKHVLPGGPPGHEGPVLLVERIGNAYEN